MKQFISLPIMYKKYPDIVFFIANTRIECQIRSPFFHIDILQGTSQLQFKVSL